MTVTIDRRSIHFGFEVFAGIMVFTICTTWAAAVYNSNSNKKQDDMLQSLIDIKKTLARQHVKDSVQDIRLDTIFSRQLQQQYRENAIAIEVGDLKDAVRTVKTIQYFTERKIRGDIHLTPVKR